MFDRLVTSKAAWTAVIGSITALGAGYTGDLPWPDVAQAVLTCALALFVRDGIAKVV